MNNAKNMDNMCCMNHIHGAQMNNNCPKDRHALLNTLRAEDFVVYETALYLNTHPCDKAALEYYKEHLECAAKLRAEYESQYGPLTMNAVCGDSWSWIDCPWPWEKEAN